MTRDKMKEPREIWVTDYGTFLSGLNWKTKEEAEVGDIKETKPVKFREVLDNE